MNLGCGVCIPILIEQYIWKCNFVTSIAMKMPILKLKCQVVSVWSPMKRVCAGSLNSDSACNDQISMWELVMTKLCADLSSFVTFIHFCLSKSRGRLYTATVDSNIGVFF